MGKTKLALEPGGPKRLELSWGMFWKNFQVILDGNLVSTVEGGQKKLKQGVEVRLPDGSELHLQLVQSAMNVELRVMRNGAPLPGSASDPAQRIKNAAWLLYLLAGLNTLLGVVTLILNIEALEAMGMGLGSILFGAIVAVLGFFTYRGTRVAPVLAIVLYVVDSLYTLYSYSEVGRAPPVAGILIRVAIIFSLVQAVKAAGELAREKESAGPGLSPNP